MAIYGERPIFKNRIGERPISENRIGERLIHENRIGERPIPESWEVKRQAQKPDSQNLFEGMLA
ncbi:MAG: hypothetical protein ACLSAO_07515 [Anaerovoracaceae bacterium]